MQQFVNLNLFIEVKLKFVRVHMNVTQCVIYSGIICRAFRVLSVINICDINFLSVCITV